MVISFYLGRTLSSLHKHHTNEIKEIYTIIKYRDKLVYSKYTKQ